MLKRLSVYFSFLLLVSAQSSGAFESITPKALHDRLIANDTLLILDVREWNEYTVDGHIAEPAGQLPFTPANMPWNSGILKTSFAKLPNNIDIVVHCKSGGRSALASAFLDSLGFTRVFNMTGGFTAWISGNYEKRTGGFGDGSGHWVRPTITRPDTIAHDSGMIVFNPASVSGMDSLYCEIHFASGKQPTPGDAPLSGINGLYRVTALNMFGLSLFSSDSLSFADTVNAAFHPKSETGQLPSLTQSGLEVLVGAGQWSPHAFNFSFENGINLYRQGERFLHRWYDLIGYPPASVPIVSQKKPHDKISGDRSFARFDLQGRLIKKNNNAGLAPVITASGYYIIATPHNHR
jgi:rhodanese-related sulfurtransferase